ncbi:unnamed protein product [Brassica oleracea var. botrytis]
MAISNLLATINAVSFFSGKPDHFLARPLSQTTPRIQTSCCHREPSFKPWTPTMMSEVETDTKSDSHGVGIFRFLQGKSYLITGATGFLAKVLIEKLVRESPEIGNIFILMKTQDQESANKRLYDEIISSDLFRLIKQTHWSSNEAFMKSKYDSALNVNALGPGRLLSFGKGCKKLKLFLHISTAYVTGNKEGKILETPLCIGENITSHLNIETEMKLASEAVRKFYGREEIKKLKELGMERMSAPLILAYGKDHIADMWGDYKSSCDIIPVDMVANATIAAMAKHGCGVSEMKAYNVTSSSSHANLLRLGELMDFSQCVTLH